MEANLTRLRRAAHLGRARGCAAAHHTVECAGKLIGVALVVSIHAIFILVFLAVAALLTVVPILLMPELWPLFGALWPLSFAVILLIMVALIGCWLPAPPGKARPRR